MDTGMGTRSDGSGVAKVCELDPKVALLISVDHGERYVMEAGFFPSGTVPTCLVAEDSRWHFAQAVTGTPGCGQGGSQCCFVTQLGQVCGS